MKKKIIVISLVLCIVIIGLTYAWFTWQSPNRTTISVLGGSGSIIVNYDGGPNISGIKLIPASSKERAESDGTGVGKTITASATDTVYMDLNMTLETFPQALSHQSLKWEIYNGNTKVGEGNFANKNQGDVINLFSGETITTTTSTYKLYIWIDGLQSNPNTMQNQDFKFVLSAEATDEEPSSSLDESGANSPVLDAAMIPVMYDTANSRWVKADSTNSDTTYQWYDYDAKKWANAVLVSSTNRSSYQSASAGTPIPESDVLAYYVWIPRYKYKVWNINKVIGTDTYNAQTTGIDIEFESGTASTGTISCSYDFTVTATESVRNETCTGSNGDYYAHPAFTFGNEEVTGFWVGKFEISSETPDVQTGSDYYGGGNVTNLTVRIKPNVRSWRYNTLTNFYKVIYDMQIENNIYGLNTSRTNTDSHMLKNMEWGAIAYLTNSKYGRCTNNTCTEVTINNSSDYITGNAGNSVSDSNYASGITNAYNTTKGQLASTTGNIYGVYDMSGGAYDYVMGNMSSAAGSYTYYASSGGSNYTYTGNEKYIDTYANGSTYNNQTAYNRARLGDATSESKSWYSDFAYFVRSSNSWFARGGDYSLNTIAGPFSFSSNTGLTFYNSSARAALLVIPSS